MQATKIKYDNIVLIGFMGSGKTTIGKRLANFLNYEFLDTDNLIEKDQRCTISELFKWQGENYFRQIETKILHQLADLQNVVLSTGGGVLTTDGNLDLLKKIGHVIYLKVNPEIMFERVNQYPYRPLLKVDDPKKKFMELLAERKNSYMQADFIIEIDKEDVTSVVNKIISSLQK